MTDIPNKAARPRKPTAAQRSVLCDMADGRLWGLAHVAPAVVDGLVRRRYIRPRPFGLFIITTAGRHAIRSAA